MIVTSRGYGQKDLGISRVLCSSPAYVRGCKAGAQGELCKLFNCLRVFWPMPHGVEAGYPLRAAYVPVAYIWEVQIQVAASILNFGGVGFRKL